MSVEELKLQAHVLADQIMGALILPSYTGVQFVALQKDAQFSRPKGCEQCGGRGYKGRTGIFEILVMDDRLRQLVTDGAGIAALRSAAKEAGMRTMLMDGMEKAAQGITTIEEVLAVVPLDTRT